MEIEEIIMMIVMRIYLYLQQREVVNRGSETENQATNSDLTCQENLPGTTGTKRTTARIRGHEEKNLTIEGKKEDIMIDTTKEAPKVTIARAVEELKRVKMK